MKILMLTPYVPYPLMSGGQIRTWNLVKRLKDKHEFTLVCFYRKEKEKQFLPELLKIFKQVYFIKKDKPWTLSSLLKSLGKYPLLMKTYDKPEAKKKISELLRENQYDLIHCEPFYVMHNLPEHLQTPVVLAEHNIEYLAYERFTNNQKLFPLKAAMKVDIGKMKNWEEHYWKKASKVIAVSAHDLKIMEEAGAGNVSLVPNGVDLETFTFSPKTADNLNTILFVGDFKWFPNIEAAKILKNIIWPEIRQKDKENNLNLWIVGKALPDFLANWHEERVKITESVPSILDAYQKSDLLLAPIYSGGGTKYKILEAMASGCAVITTSLGAEGLNAENGKDVLIAGTNELMVDMTLKLLNDPDRRLEIARSARKVIEENYNWDKISEALDNVYQSVL